MSNEQTIKHAGSNSPYYIACQIRDLGKGKKGFWTKIGSARTS